MLILFLQLFPILGSYALHTESVLKDVKPISYDLTLKIDTSGGDSYSGKVLIKFYSEKDTDRVYLHGPRTQGLTIAEKEVTVYSENAQAKQFLGKEPSIVYHETEELLEIKLRKNILKNVVNFLKIPFTGKISKSFGLKKIEHDGKFLVASDFKRTHARYVFPCFDDPKKPAKFSVSIVRRKGATSFSGVKGDPVTKSVDDVWDIDVYPETDPLSPYQIGFVVGDFQFYQDSTVPGLYFAQQTYNDYGTLINPFVKKLKELIGFLEVSGPLKFVFLPGPTELSIASQGLTLKSEHFIFDGERLNEPDKLYDVLGSLILQRISWSLTPDSWSSQWLWPCLARYTSLDTYQPNHFVKASQMLSVMKWDAHRGTKSINSITDDEGKLEQKVSEEKLEKGLVLLTMLERILGEEKGILTHSRIDKGIKKFTSLSGKASLDDFWNFIDDCGRFKVPVVGLAFKNIFPREVHAKDIMRSWTEQEGYPIITVTREGMDVKITQKRFVFTKEVSGTQNQCWWIPLTYTTAAKSEQMRQTQPMKWLGCQSTTYPSEHTLQNIVNPGDWIIFNNMMSGLYRVNYDMHNWKLISQALNDPGQITKILPNNRAQLVNDVLALCYLKEVDFDTAFHLIMFLRHEKDPANYIEWEAYFNAFEKFKDTLKNSVKLNDIVKVYQKILLTEIYSSIFINKDRLVNFITTNQNPERAELFLRIHKESCLAEVDKCVDDSYEIFLEEEWMNIDEGSGPISSRFSRELAISVLCTAVSYSTIDELASLVERVQKRWKDHVYHSFYIEALKCPEELFQVELVLNWCTTTTTNEVLEEKLNVLKGVMSSTDAQIKASVYFYNNYDKISEYFRPLESKFGTDPVKDLIETMVCELSPSQLEQVEAANFPKDENIRNILKNEDVRKCKGHQRDYKWQKENEKSLKDTFRKILEENGIKYKKEGDIKTNKEDDEE